MQVNKMATEIPYKIDTGSIKGNIKFKNIQWHIYYTIKYMHGHN